MTVLFFAISFHKISPQPFSTDDESKPRRYRRAPATIPETVMSSKGRAAVVRRLQHFSTTPDADSMVAHAAVASALQYLVEQIMKRLRHQSEKQSWARQLIRPG